MMRWRAIALFAACLAAVAHIGTRAIFGRGRADLAAWVSADDGLFAFSKQYDTGSVGPFVVGEERSRLRERLRTLPLLPDDRKQLEAVNTAWRLSLPAPSGGYITYTVHFDNDQATSITSYYSVFAGL
jgi:hypothetical protein